MDVTVEPSSDAQMAEIEVMVKSGKVDRKGSKKKEKLVSAETVSKHNKPEDCWLVIDGKVWDFSEFAPEHPGGEESMFMSLFVIHHSIWTIFLNADHAL